VFFAFIGAKRETLDSNGHAFCVVIGVRNSVRKLYGFGVSRRELESEAQRGSAVKAVFSLERFCPIDSMAPVLAIVWMVAALS